MSTAPSPFMRYDAMEQWLKRCGFSHSEVRGMVEAGLIKKLTFSSKRKCWFKAEQIENDVLKNGKAKG